MFPTVVLEPLKPGIGTIPILDTTTGTIDFLSGTNVSYSGIATLGITTINQLYVSGVSTFTGVNVANINASGIITASNGFVGNLTGTATTATNLSNAANITTGTVSIDRLTGTYNIDISGNAATASYADFAGVSTSVIGGVGSLTQLNVSGLTTSALLNVGIGGTIITTSNTSRVGINSVTPNYTLDVNGDINFGGILYKNGVEYVPGIGIQSGGSFVVGSGVTILNFVGSAVSSITNSGGGIVEINVKAGQFTRSTSTFTATAGQTSFSVNYTPNFIDVFLNGVRLTSSEFTATNGTSVVLTDAAFVDDIIDVVVFQNSGLFDSSKWSATDINNPVSGNIYKLNGNVGIGTTSGNARLDIEGVLGVDTTVTGITTTAISTIDTLPISIYRSARFQVQITQSTDYQSTDLMVVHNGTTANIIEYGSIATNDYLASFSSTISSSNLLLQATMGSAGIATVKVVSNINNQYTKSNRSNYI
jgi:hypothetical protein